MHRPASLFAASLVALSVFAGGCGGAIEPEEVEVDVPDTDTTPQIIGTQRSAAAYSEAVMVKVNNTANDYCTGTVIAPYVVLTAAHCIVFNGGPNGAGTGTWTITAQFASTGRQDRTARGGEPMDAGFWNLTRYNYESHPELHDTGVVYLDSPFTGITYPTLSSATVPASTSSVPTYVSAVGRQTSSATAGLVLSGRTTLAYPTTRDNERYTYKTAKLTGGGDSGGPLFLEGTHRLVGTEALFRQKQDFWTRIDGAVYTWLDGRITSHGGWPTAP